MSVDAKSLIAFMMADGEHENMVSYLGRGRKLGNVSDQYLEERFIDEIRRWAQTPPPWTPFDTLDDIIAESYLRGFNLPFAPVKDYLEQINTVIEATPRNEEAGEGFWQKQVARYERAKAIGN